MLFAVSLLALLPAALAQTSSVNAPLELESIEAFFTAAQLVPELIPSFSPPAVIHFSFNNLTDNAAGSALTTDQVSTPPTLTIYPVNTTATDATELYTLTMVDADVVGTDETAGQTRHWLMNDVSLSGATGSSPLTVNWESATAITSYNGPYPASGSGPHRYCIFLYSQPASFTPPNDLDGPTPLANNWDFIDYVQSTGLGPLVAGTFYTVEVGTASASIPAIPTIVTSTLPIAVSAAEATRSQTAIGGSGSVATPSGAAAPSSSSTRSGAMANKVTGVWSVVAFAVLAGVALA